MSREGCSPSGPLPDPSEPQLAAFPRAPAIARLLPLSPLDRPTLVSGVEWDSPWGVRGCHLWHLLPLQKNKSNAMHSGF